MINMAPSVYLQDPTVFQVQCLGPGLLQRTIISEKELELIGCATKRAKEVDISQPDIYPDIYGKINSEKEWDTWMDVRGLLTIHCANVPSSVDSNRL